MRSEWRWALAGLALLAPAAAVRADPPALLPKLYAAPLPGPADRAEQVFANGVKLFGGITYAEPLGYRPLKLDLYLPPNPQNHPMPVVVWFHGGGYEIGNPRADWTYGDWSAVLARLAARGYVVAGVTYRFKREAPLPAQVDDGQAAIAFLRANARLWNIDGGKVYAWGLSAGGHLAAMVGVRSPKADPAMKVQGVVDWFGPTDFASFDAAGSVASAARVLGCEGPCSPQVLAASSPAAQVGPGVPPVLIVHGEKDHLVPVQQGALFAERLRAAGDPVTYRPMPGLDHGFEGTDKAHQEQILVDTFAFFDKLAGKKPR